MALRYSFFKLQACVPWLKKGLYASAALFLPVVIACCIYYRVTPYEVLKLKYLSLNSCFYRSDVWDREFFTPAVKQKGNRLALLGIGIACAALAYILWQWRRYRPLPVVKPTDTTGWGWYAGVICLALVAGSWSWYSMAPAYDEIFSAVNCARLPLLQTVSYYMLPNNHVYFNFLNNLLFSWWGNEVVTGRLISITAYTGVLLCAWYWLQRLIPNKPLAFAALLPVALQFTVWGMAAQARGYEGQLCCFWVGFTTLFLYLQQPREWLLRLHLLASICGFLLVPTYLSCYAAQVLFFFCVMAYNRQWSWRFFIYQWLAGGIVFLFYLPAFCFSGVPAFTENRYVIPVYTTWLDFLPNFFGTLKYFINCCFSMLCGEDRAINFVLFFLPFILFFSHRKERRMAAFGFTIVWLVYIVLTLNMGRNPNNRNMIMHYSITMACVVYAFYAMMEKAAALLKPGKWRRVFLYVFFVAPVLAYCGHLVVTNRRDISFMLYYNDVNEINKHLVASMTLIPREATIGFSNEAFYMYYHFTKNKYKTVKCPDGTETYFIKQKDDEMPAAEVGKYDKVNEIYQGCEFYKHK